MRKLIDGVDFHALEPMKYYSPPISEAIEKTKKRVNDRIFSGDWYGALKRDGAFYKTIKYEDGSIELLGRSKSKTTGDYLDKLDHVPHLKEFFENLPNGTCLLGELYVESDEQAKSTTAIMNSLTKRALKLQEEEPLKYYVFDVLAWNGESFVDVPAKERIEKLASVARAWDCPYVNAAKYFSGKELWDKLQSYLSEGREGIVILNGSAPYKPGKRSTFDSLKIKKELKETIDCVVMGANAPSKFYNGKEIEVWPYWFDERQGKKLQGEYYMDYLHGAPIIPLTKAYFMNWAGSLKLGLFKDGKLIHIGNLSGISDEIKMNWRNYIHNVVEVGAMEIIHGDGGTLGLRHPKLLSWRSDKAPSECLYSQLEQ